MIIKVDKYASLEGPKFGDPTTLISFLSKINLHGKTIHVKEITPEMEALEQFGFVIEKDKAVTTNEPETSKDSKSSTTNKELPRSIMVEEPAQSDHHKEVGRDIKKNGPRREKMASLSEGKIEKIAASKLAKFGRDTVEKYLNSSVGTNLEKEIVQSNDHDDSDDDESEQNEKG